MREDSNSWAALDDVSGSDDADDSILSDDSCLKTTGTQELAPEVR